MNIKTLTYIHDLLEANEESWNRAYVLARDDFEQSKDETPTDKKLIASKARIKEDMWNAYGKASHALEDFENMDWR